MALGTCAFNKEIIDASVFLMFLPFTYFFFWIFGMPFVYAYTRALPERMIITVFGGGTISFFLIWAMVGFVFHALIIYVIYGMLIAISYHLCSSGHITRTIKFSFQKFHKQHNK